MSTQTYRLPDLLSLLPKKPGPEVNPHFQEVVASFHAWARNTLSRDCTATLAKYDSEVAAFPAFVWPESSYEWLMGINNWCLTTTLVDDLIDCGPKEDAPAVARLWLDSLWDGKTPEHPLMGVMLNDLVLSMRTALGPYHWPQFVRDSETWVLSSIQNRNKGAIDDIQAHLRMRRETICVFPCLAVTRSNRCLYIPEDVLAHPVIDEMTNAIIDVISITNDIYSFKKEYDFDKAIGNILTVIQSDKLEGTSHLDLQGALDYSGKLVEAAMERFHACVRDLPSFNSEMDAYLASYVEGIIDLIVGNVQFSRVTCRYHIFANEEDKKNNIVRWAL